MLSGIAMHPWRVAKFFFIPLLSLLLFACQKTPSSPPSPSKPLVLVSIAPYQFLAQRIGGEVIQVEPVVPPNANPHAFEPTAKQLATIARGEIWFRIGEPFEERVLAVLKGKNRALVIYDLREKIPLLEENSHPLQCHHCAMDHYDRHIWLSPKWALFQAEAMARVLSERFPQHAEAFRQNLEGLRSEFVELDREIGELLHDVKERILLVSHPAFGYFCRDYNFAQLSVEYEGKDPRPKHLEEVLQKAASEHAEFALALPQYNNKGAQLIAEKLHLPVRWIDPYSPHYFETMRELAQLIADSQKTP